MKILIYVSSHSNSKPAVEFGGLIARATQSEITLVTVIRDNQNIDSGHQILGKAKKWIPDLDLQTSFRVGSDAAGILEEISTGNYDVVVIKSRQAVMLKHFLASKISRRVAQQSPTSVLVIKRDQPDLKRILICTCGREIADPVIEMSALLAKSAQAKATLLHVTSSIPSMYTGLDRVEEHLSDLLKTDTPVAQHLRKAASLFASAGMDANMKLRHGAVPEEILVEAQSGDYDLIVIGSSGVSSSLTGWLLGDVTIKIVNQSQCPVLVVRKKQGAAS